MYNLLILWSIDGSKTWEPRNAIPSIEVAKYVKDKGLEEDVDWADYVDTEGEGENEDSSSDNSSTSLSSSEEEQRPKKIPLTDPSQLLSNETKPEVFQQPKAVVLPIVRVRIHDDLAEDFWPEGVETIKEKETYLSRWKHQNKELLSQKDQGTLELDDLAWGHIDDLKKQYKAWIFWRDLPRVSIELMHRRLGHRSVKSLELADKEKVYDDVIITRNHDPFCETCHVSTIGSTRRGGPKDEVTKPGYAFYLDIVSNPTKEGLSPSESVPYFLSHQVRFPLHQE